MKLHTLYDVKTSIPSFLYITNASVHDVNIMDIIPYEEGSFYVAAKGYPDFLRLYKILTNGSFFVTRAKENLRFKRMYSRAVDKTTRVQSDHIGKLEIYKSKNDGR
ncbi:MAG: transposase [Sedimentibacter sp.]|nr:transposase [Sedimentibacter sp.]MDW5298898.1 transposase [Sedimentibacter sp.]